MGLNWWPFNKRSKYEPEYVKAGSQRAKIIEAFAAGRWLGPYQACELIGSHKGETRFGEVVRLFKRSGITVVSRKLNMGTTAIKQYQVCSWSRERARALIVGKAV